MRLHVVQLHKLCCSFSDYQDCRGRSLSRQQTCAKEATAAKWQPEEAKQEAEEIAGVDDETRHLLESENILIYRSELTLGEIIGVGEFSKAAAVEWLRCKNTNVVKKVSANYSTNNNPPMSIQFPIITLTSEAFITFTSEALTTVSRQAILFSYYSIL